ncbi:PREDICTED: RNA-binding protein 28-like [Nicrophorus vespilloides]|uniref:RNA-binding protein 28-like n=1 Tax=Nicrophorus vespilloides TaxID=110193 RepID=A0ABM1NC21_NICVS|nr:PREDICTED: RNA-binding protein 28-like [Nicrophorus vespilloides]
MVHVSAAQRKEQFKAKLRLEQKETKVKLQEKRARLIVKNISFKSTEENLKKHFEQYGEVSEVNILKKADGKMVGCCFIQYDTVQNAHKAQFHTNDKPFLGRPVKVDFAMSKDFYENHKRKMNRKEFNREFEKKHFNSGKDNMDSVAEDNKDNIEIKEEEMDEEPCQISDDEQMDDDEKEVDEDEDDDDDEDVDDDDDDEDNDDDEADDDDEDDDDDDENDDDDDEDNDNDDEDMKSKKIKDEKKPKIKVESNDVTEGKTVFIKNLPFEATNENLKECMSQYGPTVYAVICMDPKTQHPKGTGFVKFDKKEDATKCLQAGTELQLLGTILDTHPALSRNDILDKKNNKKDVKDTRNLYLVKEGVIMAGTKAAQGVSNSDMQRRIKLEQFKTQMLKKLTMYVSPNRIIVYNLPTNWDDTKLRALMKKHAGEKAVIKEARVMRDKKTLDEKGAGISKEYGFVTFTTHEHALNALRSINNNPSIFTSNKRPIVCFSIENKVMLQIKEKRTNKSKKTNPLSKEFDPSVKKKVEIVQGGDFAGMTATQGSKKWLSGRAMQGQAKMHHENVKVAKKNQKIDMIKKTARASRVNKGMVQKPKFVKDDKVSKMVNRYKKSFHGSKSNKGKEVKKKWYE